MYNVSSVNFVDQQVLLIHYSGNINTIGKMLNQLPDLHILHSNIRFQIWTLETDLRNFPSFGHFPNILQLRKLENFLSLKEMITATSNSL